MAKVCPTCGGGDVGCPICNAPPKHVKPPLGWVEKRLPLQSSLKSILYGAPVWEVQGIDVSRWNGNMNFSITRKKCQYGFMRFGYGNGWKDSKLDEYNSGSLANDFPMGGYWFCYIGQDYVQHAQGFADEIATHQHKVGIRLDAETTTLNPQDTLNWLIACDQKLTQLTGLVAEIYTAQWFWDTKVAYTTYFSGRLNWVANWTSRDYPILPRGWTKWGDWQWQADGNGKAAEYGSTGGDPDMDLNRSIYTVSQFNARWGTHIQPIGSIPPVPPGVVPETVKIGLVDTNIRSTPNPLLDNSNVIGVAKANKEWHPDAVELDPYGKEWYRFGKKAYIKKELTRLP